MNTVIKAITHECTLLNGGPAAGLSEIISARKPREPNIIRETSSLITNGGFKGIYGIICRKIQIEMIFFFCE